MSDVQSRRDVCVVIANQASDVEVPSTIASTAFSLRVVTTIIARGEESRIGEILERERPRLAIVALGSMSSRIVDALSLLELVEFPLIAVGPSADGHLIIRLLRAGVRDFVSEEALPAELPVAINKILETESDSVSFAKFIGVMGVKGGVGATLTACELGRAISATGKRVAMVDLSIPCGDVALYFDLQPKFTMGDLSKSETAVDERAIEQTLCADAQTGIEVLAAPPRIEDYEGLMPNLVDSVLNELRVRFDWVVVDIPRTWSSSSIRALEVSNTILMVSSPDVSGLGHSAAHMELAGRFGIGEEVVRTAVVRHQRTSAITRSEIEKFLGRSPDFWIPNDYSAAIKSVSEGLPVASGSPRSPLVAAYAGMASSLCFNTNTATEPTKSGGTARERISEFFRRAGG